MLIAASTVLTARLGIPGESYHHDQQRGILILGDLSFIHDLPALVGHQAINGTIVVIDNDGGGIFDLLVSKQTDYEQLIRCPRNCASTISTSLWPAFFIGLHH